MATLSKQQITAGNEVLTAFNTSRWTILTAQMQSGKTGTYYYVAAEMLRLKIVNRIIIFSGNAETSLKEQTKVAVHKFCDMYRLHLDADKDDEISDISTNSGMTTTISSVNSADSSFQLIHKIKASVQVVWGAELTNFCKDNPHFYETLFIWDESHCAQGSNMRPDKFLCELGISPNGFEGNEQTPAKLALMRSYMLSVSATPFSEISDIVHLHQRKSIVRLEAAPTYQSIKRLTTEKRIIPFTKWTDALHKAMNTAKNQSPGYGIVRLGPNTKTIEHITNKKGWLCEYYDASPNSTIKNLNHFLSTAPKKNTIIVVRGMCRMGKELVKKHIRFCLETVTKSNTDTILQGLIGRVCGYHEYNKILVYLHEKIVHSGELQRYIEYSDNSSLTTSSSSVSSMPRYATNLASVKQLDLYPHTPILILPHMFGDEALAPTYANKLTLKNSLRALFYSDKVPLGKLSDPEMRSLQKQIENDPDGQNMTIKIIRRNGDDILPITSSHLPDKLHYLWDNGLAENHMSGKSNGTIYVYWFADAFPALSLPAGSMFVCGATSIEPLHFKIVPTNSAELFCKQYEMNLDDDHMALPQNTRDDLESLKTNITRIIAAASQETDTKHLILTNGYLPKFILLKPEFLKEFKKGGIIYNSIYSELKVKLKIILKRGKKNAAMAGYCPLNISW